MKKLYKRLQTIYLCISANIISVSIQIHLCRAGSCFPGDPYILQTSWQCALHLCRLQAEDSVPDVAIDLKYLLFPNFKDCACERRHVLLNLDSFAVCWVNYDGLCFTRNSLNWNCFYRKKKKWFDYSAFSIIPLFEDSWLVK